MMKAFAIAFVLAFGSTVAFAEDDDDKVLADLGCKDPEGVKKEEEGIYFSVILISRY